MNSQGYEVRPMARGEIDFAMDLAAAEGWNPGLSDAESFFQADPSGYFVGLLDGRAIGCISAVSYEGGFGFIGLYIVRPEFRGRGLGIQLWNAAMARLAGHNIGLDGVVAQQANYTKSGFKLAYRNIRYERTARRRMADMRYLKNARETFMQIAAYDRMCFPAARKSFLKSWLQKPTSYGLAWRENGTVLGYGVIRQCRRGYKIGPLFADRLEVARQLYLGLTAWPDEGMPIYLDVPEPNSLAQDLVREEGMAKVFETARMYTQEPPHLPVERIFGVTTFELG